MAAKYLARLALPLMGALLFAGAATAQDQGYGYGYDSTPRSGYERGYERGSYDVRAYEDDGRGWRETYRDGDSWHSDYGYDDALPADYAPPPCDWRTCAPSDGYAYAPYGGEVTLSNGFFHGGLTGGVGPSWGAGWRYGYGGRGVVIVNASASASAFAYARASSSVGVRRGGCCR